MKFKIGDRVQIKADAADGYIQPWRDRIKRGLFGTVIGESAFRVDVQLDIPKRAKRPNEWLWRGTYRPHVAKVVEEE